LQRQGPDAVKEDCKSLKKEFCVEKHLEKDGEFLKKYDRYYIRMQNGSLDAPRTINQVS